MKIQSINNVIPQINFNNIYEGKEPVKIPFSKNEERNLPPSENCKALFFVKSDNFEKIGETVITDRATGKEIKADIKKKQVTKDFSKYRLYVDKIQTGIMDLALDEQCNNAGENLSEEETGVPFERFPKVVHLRTLAGEKYSGIGTALIKAAVEESKKTGTKGALWLHSTKGYMKAMSRYRSDENPIPFYYKLGFKAPGEKHEEISSLLKDKKYDKLPGIQLLVLTPEAAEKLT